MNRSESGIEATTIRRLIFINASSDSRSHVTRDLTRGRRTDKERGVRLFRSALQETPALISIPRSEGVYTGTAISHERALVQRSRSNRNRTSEACKCAASDAFFNILPTRRIATSAS